MADNLVGPESNVVEEVDETVAVGAEEGEVASTADKLRRQTPPLAGTGFGEASGETHKTACTPPGQARSNVRNLARWRCNERSVGGAGEFIDGTKVLDIGRGRALRMNAP